MTYLENLIRLRDQAIADPNDECGRHKARAKDLAAAKRIDSLMSELADECGLRRG